MTISARFDGAEVRIEVREADLSLSAFRLTTGEALRLARELSHALIASGVLGRKQATTRTPPCPGRRAYESEDAARAANRSAPWRIRAYRCPGCGKWHTTNHEKGRRPGPKKKEPAKHED